MGERLVVTIKAKDEEIAKIYYHWSAYSLDAISEVRQIVQSFPYVELDRNDLILHLIRYAEANGGGIQGGKGSDEWNYILEKFPNERFKSENISRNDGLIAISQKGMGELQHWSEGDMLIDYDRKWIGNQMLYVYSSEEEFRICYGDYEVDDIEDMTKILADINLFEFGFEEIDNVSDVLYNMPDIFKLGNNEICCLVS